MKSEGEESSEFARKTKRSFKAGSKKGKFMP